MMMLPHYPQSNELTEKDVGTAKDIMQKALKSWKEQCQAMLNYRSASPSNGLLSPSEILNQHTHIDLPMNQLQQVTKGW